MSPKHPPEAPGDGPDEQIWRFPTPLLDVILELSNDSKIDPGKFWGSPGLTLGNSRIFHFSTNVGCKRRRAHINSNFPSTPYHLIRIPRDINEF